MKHRFLLHSLNHNILIVDISQFRIENPEPGNFSQVPAVRLSSWKQAKQFFQAKDADEDTLQQTLAVLNKSGVAVMTIV